jgi:hypothetical protein
VIVGGAYLVAPGRIGLALVAIVSIPVGLWIFVVLGLGAEAFREDALFLATVVALAVAGLTSLGTIAFLVGSSLGWFFEP